jgi:hypothetical protein
VPITTRTTDQSGRATVTAPSRRSTNRIARFSGNTSPRPHGLRAAVADVDAYGGRGGVTLKLIDEHERTGSSRRDLRPEVSSNCDARAPCYGTFDPDVRPSTRQMLCS